MSVGYGLGPGGGTGGMFSANPSTPDADKGFGWGDAGKLALQYLLPSFITGGLSFLGGAGQAQLSEKTLKQQMAFQAAEGKKNRSVDLYNSSLNFAFQKYLNDQDRAKAQRLRRSIMQAFSNASMVGGPGMILPYTPEPQAPTPQGVAGQVSPIAQAMGV